VILHTNDGGTTWITQMNNSDESPLMDVHFVSNAVGYAVGESGAVLSPNDGGATWVEKMDDSFYHFLDGFFVDETNGWVVGQYLGLPHVSVIFSTTDGGESWTSQTFGEDETLSCVYFVNEVMGWAGGGSTNSCTILKTEDGGETWNPEDPGITNPLYAMHFHNDVLGWAVGYNGTIISTQLNTGLPRAEQDDQFMVYPNPSTGKIAVHLDPAFGDKVSVRIQDMTGRTVYADFGNSLIRQPTRQLDLSEAAESVYMISVSNGETRLFRKIIIAR
jgi:photosystem II stability/assembly factor-like uncharacterized protein